MITNIPVSDLDTDYPPSFPGHGDIVTNPLSGQRSPFISHLFSSLLRIAGNVRNEYSGLDV